MGKIDIKLPNREDKAWSPFIVHENGCMKVLNQALTWSECEDVIERLQKKFKGKDKEYGIMEHESVPVFAGRVIVEADDYPDPVPRRKKDADDYLKLKEGITKEDLEKHGIESIEIR